MLILSPGASSSIKAENLFVSGIELERVTADGLKTCDGRPLTQKLIEPLSTDSLRIKKNVPPKNPSLPLPSELSQEPSFKPILTT